MESTGKPSKLPGSASSLRKSTARVGLAFKLFEYDTLVGRMLIDEHQAIIKFTDNIGTLVLADEGEVGKKPLLPQRRLSG